MTVYAAVSCGVGKAECEDAALVGHSIVCNEDTIVEMPESGVVCLADGVGGNAGGRFASSFVVEYIRDNLLNAGSKDLPQFFKQMDAVLIAAGNANKVPIAATTLTGIVFASGKQYFVHIGNTRAYILQGQYLKQLTTDHTVYNRLLKMGRIDEAYSSNRNEITNCFGGGKTTLLDSLVVMEIQDFTTLLLTSDGVHDYIKIEELELQLTSDAPSVSTCNRIIQAAVAAGSRDDASVVILKK